VSDNNHRAENDATEQELLGQLREKIDSIDGQIGDLICARAECAQQVAEIKRRFSPDQEPVFYRPEREAQVLRRAMERNRGPLKNEEFARLFREIMSACLALEKPIGVAYLGPEGTFTQQAALKHFGHSAHTVALPAIDDVFREVESGSVQFGVVPVENSTGGVVAHTLDNFMESNLNICGEVVLRIHHHLMVSNVTKTDKISRIYSHSQSLAQCRKWLEANYPNAEKIAVNSNAEAAKRVASEWNSAAIAGEMAANLYGLNILSSNIEDRPDNATRFLIIGRQNIAASGDDKTSIVVAMRNEPGALHNLLAPFHRLQIDLTRVETRPSQTSPWTYVFFLDFVGHQQDEKISSALHDVTKNASEIKILGSYPKGVL
jgi:chorismate mutase / prephenate dehydratase